MTPLMNPRHHQWGRGSCPSAKWSPAVPRGTVGGSARRSSPAEGRRENPSPLLGAPKVDTSRMVLLLAWHSGRLPAASGARAGELGQASHLGCPPDTHPVAAQPTWRPLLASLHGHPLGGESHHPQEVAPAGLHLTYGQEPLPAPSPTGDSSASQPLFSSRVSLF